MVSKSHLFEGASDVAHAFVARYLIDNDPDIAAKNLRAYARISVTHRDEVAALLRQEDRREVLFCSTRHALPSLLKDAKAAGRHKVDMQAISALCEAAPCLYANVSWPVLVPGSGSGKLLTKILAHPSVKEVRLDMSGPNDQQTSALSLSEETKQSGCATAMEADALYRHVLKGLRLRKASAPLKIALIHRRALNELALASALEKLRPYCKVGQDIFIQSIDLSDPVSKSFHIDSGSFQLWNIAPAFLDRMTEWIGAVDSSLRTVKLGGMRLGEANLIQIANALRESQNAALREVDLSGNRIRKFGATKLAEALAVNPHIKILNLEDNQIEDTGASTLYLCLQRNKSLDALHLGGNSISHDHVIWNEPRVAGRPDC